MTTKHITYESDGVVGLKVDVDQDLGIATALVSVWDVIDLQGDRVLKGAFRKSLRKWAASGDKIPAIFSHSWSDPMDHVGEVISAKETDEGLLVKVQFDLDTERGRQVWKLVKTRRVKEWSFAYDILEERTADDGANELVTLDIIECGPCLKGANPLTRTVSAKNTTFNTTSNIDVVWSSLVAKGVVGASDAKAKADKADPEGDPAYWNIILDGNDEDPKLDRQVDDLVNEVRHEVTMEQLRRLEAQNPRNADRTEPHRLVLGPRMTEESEDV